VRRRKRRLVQKFFADRGTHLGAMIAYFALLSFVPLTFLALSLLGLVGRADESSFLVVEIKHALPETPIEDIVRLVRTVQDNAWSLGIVGGAFLLWTSLSLFSALESAFNIVYARPNRSFIHGKGLAVGLLMGGLFTLFFALMLGSFGVELLKREAPWFIDNAGAAYGLTVGVSTLGVFAFLLASYYLLPNERMRLRDVLPGTVLGTVLLQVSFQVLPVFVRYAELNPVLKTFGSPVILLVWLYVMANVIVLGAELNWWVARRRARVGEGLPGLA
jgi:membrane protein